MPNVGNFWRFLEKTSTNNVQSTRQNRSFMPAQAPQLAISGLHAALLTAQMPPKLTSYQPILGKKCICLTQYIAVSLHQKSQPVTISSQRYNIY